MTKNLWRYLCQSYVSRRNYFLHNLRSKQYIQIDDQDDSDNIGEFCNIFINFKNNNTFEIELLGKMPITQEIADLAEIYQGGADYNHRKINMVLKPEQIEAVAHLASLIRKTAPLGEVVGNAHWQLLSSRTISSLNRFVRIIKEYATVKQNLLV
ncbi:MAG: hypothetical protein JW795_12365 [Chitinivibrionales bacterium]|nr:hypothetical protein [Chitinivibrionales bacterium]